jgi:hypothetical protein
MASSLATAWNTVVKSLALQQPFITGELGRGECNTNFSSSVPGVPAFGSAMDTKCATEIGKGWYDRWARLLLRDNAQGNNKAPLCKDCIYRLQASGWVDSHSVSGKKNWGASEQGERVINRSESIMADSRAEGQRQGMLEKKRKKMMEEFEKQKEQISKVSLSKYWTKLNSKSTSF